MQGEEIKLSARHSKSHEEQVMEILRYFENYKENTDKLYNSLEQFNRVAIDKEIIEACVNRVLKIDESEEISSRKANMVDELKQSIIGETLDIGLTAFGLFEGVTHYTTHKKKGDPLSIFGTKAEINNKAFQFCQELV